MVKPCPHSLELVPGRALALLCGVHVGWDELKAYNTLLWVLRTVIVGYVLISLSTKGGFGPVRAIYLFYSFLCSGILG